MGIEIYFGGALKKVLEAFFRENSAEEIRLRVNRPLRVIIDGKMSYLDQNGRITDDVNSGVACIRDDLEKCLELMSDYSLYAFYEEVRNGFITLPGGHRVGICGQAVCERGDIRSIKNISSMNIRLASEHKGAAKKIVPFLIDKRGRFFNTLIASGPGYGKTTLLRDIVRIVSDSGINVSVIDERSEIAACYKGIPQNDVGCCTDVLDQAPKDKGIWMVLRSMAPGIIAVDEINTDEDMQAIKAAKACGASLLCTIHSQSNVMEQELVGERIFDRYIELDDSRVCSVFDAGGKLLYTGSIKGEGYDD